MGKEGIKTDGIKLMQNDRNRGRMYFSNCDRKHTCCPALSVSLCAYECACDCVCYDRCRTMLLPSGGWA